MAAGQRIEDLRIALGWTQQRLANEVTRRGFKITQSGIDKLEKRDAKRPRGLREIAAVLGVHERWLLEEKGPKEAQQPKGFLAIDDDYDEEIEREVERYRAYQYAKKREKEGASTVTVEGPRNALEANRTHR